MYAGKNSVMTTAAVAAALAAAGSPFFLQPSRLGHTCARCRGAFLAGHGSRMVKGEGKVHTNCLTAEEKAQR